MDQESIIIIFIIFTLIGVFAMGVILGTSLSPNYKR